MEKNPMLEPEYIDRKKLLGKQKYINGDADWEFDGFANLKCIGYKNGTLAVQNIINGNCKLVVIDEAPAGFITEALNKLN
jgi:polar amino acid transport system substrate-binding protein